VIEHQVTLEDVAGYIRILVGDSRLAFDWARHSSRGRHAGPVAMRIGRV